MKAYRMLALRYDVLELPPEAQQNSRSYSRSGQSSERGPPSRPKMAAERNCQRGAQPSVSQRNFVHAYNALERLRGRVIRRGKRDLSRASQAARSAVR
jgi:hypothetical protein